jgi:membrane protein YdbS with pleckstrin-like domain
MVDSGRSIVRSSRKGYIVYYVMIVLLLFLMVYIKVSGFDLNYRVSVAALIFMALLIKLTEVDRFAHHYEIGEFCLEKVEGIFFKKYKRMNYGSISQIHFTQNPWEKLLGIGSVEIAQFSETIRTEIKNINKPNDFVHAITKRIHNKESGSGVYGN